MFKKENSLLFYFLYPIKTYNYLYNPINKRYQK